MRGNRRSIRLTGYDYTRPGEYFITLCVQNRECLFGEILDGEMRLNAFGRVVHDEWLQTAVIRPEITLDAFVVMPDHLHAVWQLPPNDKDFSLRWSIIKQHVTRDCTIWLPQQDISTSREKRGEGGLWQRRFWEHLIRDEADFSRHLDYIHYNPVKHGYVANTGDWPYSTFHRYVKQGVYPADWGGVADVSGNFGE